MISSNYVTVVPAYGRDYKSGAAAKADFIAGKDFLLQSFGHPESCCSISDFTAGVVVNLRYAKLTKVVGCKVQGHVVVNP